MGGCCCAAAAGEDGRYGMRHVSLYNIVGMLPHELIDLVDDYCALVGFDLGSLCPRMLPSVEFLPPFTSLHVKHPFSPDHMTLSLAHQCTLWEVRSLSFHFRNLESRLHPVMFAVGVASVAQPATPPFDDECCKEVCRQIKDEACRRYCHEWVDAIAIDGLEHLVHREQDASSVLLRTIDFYYSPGDVVVTIVYHETTATLTFWWERRLIAVVANITPDDAQTLRPVVRLFQPHNISLSLSHPLPSSFEFYKNNDPRFDLFQTLFQPETI
jgi:hypothetical protein